MKGTRFSRWISLSFLTAVLVGCSKTETQTVVVIRGSNTFGEELAPRLMAEYTKEHPDVTFDAEFKGTTYGVGALLAGRGDIAAASRVLTTNELQMARSRDIKLHDYVVGSYSVAVVANAGNPVGNLTADQVRDIFTGAVKNWNEVGGPDTPIHLYVRDPISGTYIGFQELAMEKKPYADGLKTFTNYADIVQAVVQDASGIGYSSVELTTNAGVKAVSVGGVTPSIESVRQGRYPYARVVRLYTDMEKRPFAAREFIHFVQSPRGQQILDEMGFVPDREERPVSVQ